MLDALVHHAQKPSSEDGRQLLVSDYRRAGCRLLAFCLLSDDWRPATDCCCIAESSAQHTTGPPHLPGPQETRTDTMEPLTPLNTQPSRDARGLSPTDHPVRQNAMAAPRDAPEPDSP